MTAPELLLQNRTGLELHLIMRPLNGTLRILVFPSPLKGSLAVPAGATARCKVDDVLASCIRGSRLCFELRNRSGMSIALGMGKEDDTGMPAIVIFPGDEGG